MTIFAFKQFPFLSILLLSICIEVHGQKHNKKVVYPLKQLLHNIDTLIVQGHPMNNKGFRYDTLFKMDIQHLANQSFFNKNIEVGEYGATPMGIIHLYKNDTIIVRIRSWTINKTQYAVNISVNEQFWYSGLVISRITFDKLFANIHKQNIYRKVSRN